MPESILDRIAAQRRLDVAQARETTPEAELLAAADALRARLGAPVALDARILAESPRLAVAAEFKRASPSKGDIAPDLDPARQCATYAAAGAAVVSVLTEPTWFRGSLDDMLAVREALDGEGRPAVLRKDFVVDAYQVAEAAAFGADSLLLIVAILTPEELEALIARARELALEPLVEVNSVAELDVALAAGARVIGVNNRNLHTFEVDLDTTSRVADRVGSDVVLVALSGVSRRADVERYADRPVAAVLVGEALMRAADPAALVRELAGGAARRQPIVKVCGLTSCEDALMAARAGATLLGVIMVEASPRCVPVERAAEIVAAVRRFGERTGRGTDMAARGRPLVVGVFQNSPMEDVLAATEAAGFDVVQLHGDESPMALPVPTIKVLHVSASTTPEELRAEAERHAASTLLLDTRVAGAQGGGTGKTFDWGLVDVLGLPVIVAGGLTPDNVGSLSSPLVVGVDVSSGVEAEVGVKDEAAVRRFVEVASAS